jgi:hypothetical protein
MGRVVLLCMTALLVVLLVRPTSSQPAAPPPDIQAIIDKRKNHQALTPEDIAKLMEWGQQLNQHLGGRPASGSGAGSGSAGIPVRITAQIHWTRSSSKANLDYTKTLPNGNADGTAHDGTQSSQSELAMSMSQDIVLAQANIGGTDNYQTGLLDPAKHISSFIFASDLTPDGKLKSEGTGTYDYKTSFKSKDQQAHWNTSELQGQLRHISAGMLLTSTGTDELWPSGGVGGGGTGILTGADSVNGSHPVQNDVQLGDNRSISPPFPWEQKFASDSKQPHPAPHAHIKYKDVVAAVTGTGSTTITVAEPFDWTDPNGEHITGQSTLTLVFRPPPAKKLLIEPVDKDKYTKWVPAPVDAKYAENGQKGTLLAMRVRFEDPTVSAPISVWLDDLSTNRGTCDNDPLAGTMTKGLQFADQDKQPKNIKVIDPQHVTTDGQPATSVVVMVEAKDTAAYGKLYAQSEIKNAVADAKSIPLDDNHNYIADAWEKQANVYEKNYPANWDAEDSPNGPDTGDGLTLYEEYRGVIISDDGTNEKFERFAPDKKKVFFLVDPSLLPNPTKIDLVGSILKGLTAHQRIAKDTVIVFRKESELADEAGALHTRHRMNPNSDPDNKQYFHNKHYAVAFVSDADGADPTVGVRRVNGSAVGDGVGGFCDSPDDCAAVELHPNANIWYVHDWSQLVLTAGPFTQSWMREHNLTGDAFSKRLLDPQFVVQIATNQLVYTTIHETGHVVGRHHHQQATAVVPPPADSLQNYENLFGPPDTCPMHYWNFGVPNLEYLGGFWDPGSSALVGQPPADPPHAPAGWIKNFHAADYHYDDNGEDDARVEQGGKGAPRYKHKE